FKNASVTEKGIYHHWHCDACNNDYADADGTENMTGKTVKARYKADALLVGNTVIDESHLLGSEAMVTIDGGNIHLNIGGNDHEYTLSKSEYLTIDFAHTFKLKANQDPDSKGDYYATFYTSEGAYKTPSGAKAYTGNVEPTADPDVDALRMTDTEGLIHKSEPVILKASQSDITLMPSINKEAAAAENALTGTDVAIAELGANDFALTLGQNGVGFYIWEGKEIAANKAYLTLDPSSQVKALIFVFDDDDPTADSINDIQRSDNSGNDVMYNLSGMRVDENYKGIVIKNGKKYLVR
ncbi:MAG: hypothetical protein MJY95_06965, partial [Bacteroidaceae bacterium]|nr:hypothetical protein [Bacteroidaceae bacterium]